MEQSAKLRKIRKEKNISRDKIAARCDVSESTVGHWETGHSPIPLLAGERICEIYEVNPDWWSGKNENLPMFLDKKILKATRKALAAVAGAGHSGDIKDQDEPENIEIAQWLQKVRKRVPRGKNPHFYKNLGLKGNQSYNNWEQARVTIPAWSTLRVLRKYGIAEDLHWWMKLPVASKNEADGTAGEQKLRELLTSTQNELQELKTTLRRLIDGTEK